MIMMGFATGMITDLGAMLTSIKGLLLGVGSSFTTAVESVVVKRFLTKGDEGMWQMVWMTNCMALACYFPLFIISGEYTVFSGLYNSAMDLDVANAVAATEASGQLHAFLYTAAATGAASFLLTLATFLQISVTSPTTHMIVTAAPWVESGLWSASWAAVECMLGAKTESSNAPKRPMIEACTRNWMRWKPESQRRMLNYGRSKHNVCAIHIDYRL
jgi:GDP-fucose transporter C1